MHFLIFLEWTHGFYEEADHFFKDFFTMIFSFSIIVYLHYSVHFYCSAEWPSHIYFFSHYPPSCSIISDYSSLCSTAGSHFLHSRCNSLHLLTPQIIFNFEIFVIWIGSREQFPLCAESLTLSLGETLLSHLWLGLPWCHAWVSSLMVPPLFFLCIFIHDVSNN